MSREDIAVDQVKIDVVALRHGTGDLGWDSQVAKDPASEAMANEEGSVLVELSQRERDAERVETMDKLLDHVMRDFRRTGDVEEVGRKVVSMAKYVGHSSVDDWSLSDIGKAFKQGKATVSARIKRECNAPVEAAGGVSDAKWQQGAEQRGVSAQAQRGNSNRKKK